MSDPAEAFASEVWTFLRERGIDVRFESEADGVLDTDEVLLELAGHVSRETCEHESSSVDARRAPLGTLVYLVPKRSAPDRSRHLGTFIQWAGDGPLDRDALLILDVEGERVEVLEREYSVRYVR